MISRGKLLTLLARNELKDHQKPAAIKSRQDIEVETEYKDAHSYSKYLEMQFNTTCHYPIILESDIRDLKDLLGAEPTNEIDDCFNFSDSSFNRNVLLNPENYICSQHRPDIFLDVTNLDLTNLEIVDENLNPLSGNKPVVSVITNYNNISEADIRTSDLENEPETTINQNILPRDALFTQSEIEDQLETVKNQDIFATDVPYTKSGNERKKRKFLSSRKERQEYLSERKKEKYMLKKPCENCKQKCPDRINLTIRTNINKMFQELNCFERKMFIANHIEQSKAISRNGDNPRKENSIKYFLKGESGKKERVCKKLFLATLGFSANNDTVLRSVYKLGNYTEHNLILNKVDRRGSCPNKNKIDRKTVLDHIGTFAPSISHYRREHAPMRLYLPSDLTIASMHKHFLETHPSIKCSYEVYRHIVSKELNISFTKLGHEECEKCEIFALHSVQGHSKDNLVDTCEECSKWKKHIEHAKSAREFYRLDAAEKKSDGNSIFYSADMQKIIMLPRMEMFKQVIFCPRLIAFNESFVPLGKGTKNVQPFAVLWHEAIAGRKKEQLISAFHAFFLHFRDVQDITLWVDNCTAQNKNWCLFSFLVYIVNSNEVGIKTIRLKYFEPGHTFMSADSFHHRVEQNLRQTPKVADFQDFVSAVRGKNSMVFVKEMIVSDFRHWPDLASMHQLKKSGRPILKDICFIEVRRGIKHIFYKTSFEGEFKEMHFLGKKYLNVDLKPPECLKEARGINAERKQNIIKNLCGLMPTYKANFWNELEENESSATGADEID